MIGDFLHTYVTSLPPPNTTAVRDRVKPEETPVEARCDTDVQLVFQLWGYSAMAKKKMIIPRGN